ncbi:MAG: twin-arginine translocase TatA/TatE family subunit [SAR202 cluster bacterium]|nr:twin-arginine translocase TatA/TatE family subunit [SAR202 cluster bacterium]
MRFGAMELGIILVIVLLVFGAGKLPQVGSSLGKAISSFRRGVSGEDTDKASEKSSSTPAKS